MKNLKLLFLLLISTIAGCSKNPIEPSHVYTASEIEGKWKLAVIGNEEVNTNSRAIYTFNSDCSMTVSQAIGKDGSLSEAFVPKRKGTFCIEKNVISIKLENGSIAEKWLIKQINGGTFEFQAFSGEAAPENGAISKLERVRAEYASAIIGLWEGVSLEGVSDYGGEDHRWGYMEDNSYVYYTRDRYRWVPSTNVSNTYYVDGDWLMTIWQDNKGNSYYESWDLEVCDDSQMIWTASRQKPDGTPYSAKFVLKKLQGEDPKPATIVGTYLNDDNMSEWDEFEPLAKMYEENGISEVYYLCKGTSGRTLYNKTDLTDAPHAWLTLDCLETAIEVMHKHNIKVYAWLFFSEDKAYLNAHPESGIYHFRTGLSDQFVELQDEGYQEYCCNTIREIEKNYDVDGFILDHVRYSGAYFGWSEQDYNRLTTQYGLSLDEYNELVVILAKTFGYSISKNDAGRYVYESDDPELSYEADNSTLFNSSDLKCVKAFMDMRVNCIDDFSTKLYNERNGKTMIFCCMPEICYPSPYAALHYGTVCNGKYILDHMSPMLYSADFEEDSNWVQNCYEYIVNLGYNTMPSLQAYKPASNESLRADIKAITESGCRHYVLFRSYSYDIAKAYEAPEETTVTYSKGTWSSCSNVTIYLENASSVESISLSEGFSGQEYNFDKSAGTITLNADCLGGIGDCGIVTIKGTGAVVKVGDVRSDERIVWFSKD